MLRDEAELAGEGRVPHDRVVPLVVVDDALRPVGLLLRTPAPAAREAAGAPRAA